MNTHHSPVSGMMHSSFHDVVQTEILWGKIETRQLIHNKRKESGGRRGKGKREGVGGSKREEEGRRERLRWVKTGSEHIIRDTEVYEESATICGSGI